MKESIQIPLFEVQYLEFTGPTMRHLTVISEQFHRPHKVYSAPLLGGCLELVE